MLIPFGILAATGGETAGAFELISTTLISSNTAAVNFNVSALAGTYKHLQIRVLDRSSASINSQLGIRFNSDTGSNYSEHQIAGGGSGTPGTYGGGSTTFAPLGSGAESGFTTSGYSARIIDILDPFSSSKNKTIRQLSGKAGSANSIGLFSAGWYNTATVTSIDVFMNGGNLVSGSRLSIYGIKG